ncbi:unnamed protein product [Rotaria socialis]|uniref:MULE transposase domain-containing protein n=1 Tax=Rotaria socialis TaxID=392032 RepID=A0A821CEU7_9BILA|nr:unnamed protein product [Rotaria socialis]CAF4601329.1 unnamed protein product [Rotaria socialis]
MDKSKSSTASSATCAEYSANVFSVVSKQAINSATVETSSEDFRARPRRIVQNFLLVWLDANIAEGMEDSQKSLAELRKIFVTVQPFTGVDQCVEGVGVGVVSAHAAITDEPTSTIIHSALRAYPLGAAGQLPKNESLMLMIQRQRTTETVGADWSFTRKIEKKYRGEGFILHQDKKLIIFTKKTNLSILKQNKHWCTDGTFKMCPDDYYQLFILHAMMIDAIIPLVYGLLIGNSAEDYNLFFEKVLKQDNFQPESNMTDFETGTIQSVKDLLSTILHKGCLFHFSQAVWRQVQRKGLTTKYNEDEVFRLNVKQLIALAFVSLD